MADIVHRTEPKKGFQTPPEVTRYFRDKRDRPAFSWLDVWGEEHARAFTVAKATETELLTAFRGSIDKALEDGQGFETWRVGIEAELKRLGWWGPRKVVDPTGMDPARLVDFSRPRRLSTMFWANMSSARAAGQWDRIQRTKRALPFLLYVRSTAGDPRPEHLAWAGIILPVDDPFWRTHFPPNGWGCKCTVRQITARERDALLAKGEQRYATTAEDAEELVVKFRAEAPDDGAPVVHINRRTGVVTEIPVGIDAGWHTSPGLARAETLVDRLNATLEQAGEATARTKIRELVTSPEIRTLAKLPERARLPVAVAPDLAEELGARSGLVAMSNDTIGVKVGKHGIAVEDVAVVQQLLDTGERLGDMQRDTVRNVVGEVDGELWRTAIGVSAAGFLYIRTLHKTSRSRIARLLRDLRAAGRT